LNLSSQSQLIFPEQVAAWAHQNSRKTMRREGQSTPVAVPDTDGPTE
jgi:hypothetical protein